MKSFDIKTKIYFGESSLDRIEQIDSAKVLVVADPFVVKSGLGNHITSRLERASIDYEIFSDVIPDPTIDKITQGVAVLVKSNADTIIAVGGGSAIDQAKAMREVVCKMDEYRNKQLRLIAVPTTSGTGSEATRFTIITNTEKDIKMLLKGAVLMPDVAVVDPAFTMTAPKSVTAATGLDALCHAAEAYTSRKAQPLTDGYALSAIKKIFKYLPVCYNQGDDVNARAQMSLAALEAGIAFNNASVTVIHGMSRPIGALFHVPHGISNAMLLCECFSYVYDGAYSRFADMARAIGAADESDSDESAAKKFIDECKKLCDICEIPTLEAYGIDKDEFFSKMDKMAGDAVASGSPANTIKAVEKDDVLAIYKNLWK